MNVRVEISAGLGDPFVRKHGNRWAHRMMDFLETQPLRAIECTVEFDEESDRIWARILIDEHWVASYAGEMQRHMDAIYKLATGTPVCGHLELGMEIERILQQIKATLDLAIGVINAAPY